MCEQPHLQTDNEPRQSTCDLLSWGFIALGKGRLPLVLGSVSGRGRSRNQGWKKGSELPRWPWGVVFGMKGRGQCTDAIIHPSLCVWSLSTLSSKTQHTGYKTSQICHLSSSERVQEGALHHSEGWTDGRRGTSTNAFVLGHHDLDLTVSSVTQASLSSQRGLLVLLSPAWCTCPEHKPENIMIQLPAVCVPVAISILQNKE